MNPFLKFIRAFYSVYAMLTFVLLLLVIFPFVLLASVFGKIKGGNIIYWICGIWSDVWFFLIGVWAKKIIQTNAPQKNEQYIFVANHISYMDIPMIVKTIRQPVRALGKAEIAKVPVFGFLYRYGAIMVDRSSLEARKKSVLQLKSVLKKGISVFIFPEGTFNETGKALKSFYDGAFRIAIETQTPIKPVLFLDNYDLLNNRELLGLKHGKSRAVFLEEISPEGFTLKQISLFKQKVYTIMENKLKDYHVSWIQSPVE